jgi:hypothetical protein
MNIETIENILAAYSFEDILEMNDLELADVLLFLHDEDFLELPDPEPV